jgi:putative ABC transport system permease protein
VGARIKQTAGLYAVTVLVFGAVALVLALPVSAAAARGLVGYAARVLNFDALPFHLTPRTFAVEAAVALLLPLAAAAGPIFGGSRITIREAISGGRPHSDRQGLWAWLAERLDLSGALAIAFGNATRKKLRAAFTMATLIIGTATFIAVLSARSSIGLTLDQRFDLARYDVQLDTRQPYQAAALEAQALAVPGVARVETWQLLPAYRIVNGVSKSDTMQLIGLDPGTDLVRPVVVAGRWLLPNDRGAAVVNTDALRFNPDIHVGDELQLGVNRLTTRWRVAGIIRGFGTGAAIYASYPDVGAAAGTPLQASRVAVVAADHTATGQKQLAGQLQQRYARAGLQLSQSWSMAEIRVEDEGQWAIVINFLLAMSVLMGIVGGLGLAGTMGINVTERTREIGVMRAVGARNRTVLLTVMGEGVLLALLSWIIGLAASFPLSGWFSGALGKAFIYTPLAYRYSVSGALLWLAILLAVAVLASYLPARRAARLTVRDVLSYDG